MSQSVETLIQNSRCICVNQSTLEGILIALLSEVQERAITADQTNITADSTLILANQLIL